MSAILTAPQTESSELTLVELDPISGEPLTPFTVESDLPDHDAQGGWPQYEVGYEWDHTPADLGHSAR